MHVMNPRSQKRVQILVADCTFDPILFSFRCDILCCPSRYDVRGALYDLTEAESGGGVDRMEGLSEEERAEEELCEYERYLALYHDEVQMQAYQGKKRVEGVEEQLMI